MLGDSPSTIRNAPEVREVDITKGILESVGVDVDQDGSTITVAPVTQPTPRVSLEFSGLNRIPILLLGPLLSRVGEAFVPLVGGDRLGQRPIDFHVNALEALGAEVEVLDDGVWAKADRLRGARITLPYPSVMATETVLLASVLADGRTVLSNAATEPEVIELALFLQRMGASIELQPERRIVIEGVDRAPRRVDDPGRATGSRRSPTSAPASSPGQGPCPGLLAGPARHRHQHPASHGRPRGNQRRLASPHRSTARSGRQPSRPTPTPGS